jgi:hypothetical protein
MASSAKPREHKDMKDFWMNYSRPCDYVVSVGLRKECHQARNTKPTIPEDGPPLRMRIHRNDWSNYESCDDILHDSVRKAICHRDRGTTPNPSSVTNRYKPKQNWRFFNKDCDDISDDDDLRMSCHRERGTVPGSKKPKKMKLDFSKFHGDCGTLEEKYSEACYLDKGIPLEKRTPKNNMPKANVKRNWSGFNCNIIPDDGFKLECERAQKQQTENIALVS